MPSRNSPLSKTHAKRRAAQAAAVLKGIDRIWNHLPKVPSFTGKARFMDMILRVQTRAHNLSWDLERDADRDKD